MTDSHPLTLEQAARRLGVATRTMQRYVEAYDKHDDRSKGFDAVKVATQRGRGYVWRFRLDADTTAPPHHDASSNAAAGASGDAPGASVAQALVDASGGQHEALQLVLAALGEARRESADLAYRLGVSETERDELRRRAEQAETERDRLVAAQAAPEAPGAPEGAAAAQGDARGVWVRLARWWRGA